MLNIFYLTLFPYVFPQKHLGWGRGTPKKGTIHEGKRAGKIIELSVDLSGHTGNELSRTKGNFKENQ
jgi:hypothetical protein